MSDYVSLRMAIPSCRYSCSVYNPYEKCDDCLKTSGGEHGTHEWCAGKTKSQLPLRLVYVAVRNTRYSILRSVLLLIVCLVQHPPSALSRVALTVEQGALQTGSACDSLPGTAITTAIYVSIPLYMWLSLCSCPSVAPAADCSSCFTTSGGSHVWCWGGTSNLLPSITPSWSFVFLTNE